MAFSFHALPSASLKMKNLVLRFLTSASWWLATCGLLLCASRNNPGAAIEYGITAASISIAIIATVSALGTQMNSTLNSISRRPD
jgi:Flp pilus assembly pilin Flp